MRILLAAVGAAALPLAIAAPAAADGHEASVSVFHGVPGLTVDVYANGDLLLEDFEPGTITDPVTLPEGDYNLQVFPADADPEADDPAIEADATVPGGANITVAAHLDADGTPTLTPFVNDVSATAPGEGRLTARHTAAAPEVDIRGGGEVVFGGVANGSEGTVDLPAGTVSADVVLAGESEPVLGPADVDVTEGVNTIVFAWGSAEDGSLDLAVQTIEGLHSTPDSIPSGNAGLLTDALPWQLGLVALAGAGIAVVAGTRAVRARSRA